MKMWRGMNVASVVLLASLPGFLNAALISGTGNIDSSNIALKDPAGIHVIAPNGEDNTILLAGGNDRYVEGADQIDLIGLSGGNDNNVNGMAGNDIINGEEGIDTRLYGGLGNDQVLGGKTLFL